MTLQEQPNLTSILKDASRAALMNLHTAMPGIVQAYDPKTQRADIQPVNKRVYEDGSVVDLPLLPAVPVLMPRTKNSWVNLPLAQGDMVLLVFCERSIEQWRLKGGIVDPLDTRTHHLADAIAIPGVFPESTPFAGHDKNLELVNGLAKVSLDPLGKVTFGNGTIELLGLFDDLISALGTAITNTAIGPQPLVQPLFAIIQAKLAQIKGT